MPGKRLFPRDRTVTNVDELADELVAVHVDSAINIDGVRRRGPDEVSTPHVRFCKRWSTDSILLHVLHGLDGNAYHILLRRTINLGSKFRNKDKQRKE